MPLVYMPFVWIVTIPFIVTMGIIYGCMTAKFSRPCQVCDEKSYVVSIYRRRHEDVIEGYDFRITGTGIIIAKNLILATNEVFSQEHSSEEQRTNYFVSASSKFWFNKYQMYQVKQTYRFRNSRNFGDYLYVLRIWPTLSYCLQNIRVPMKNPGDDGKLKITGWYRYINSIYTSLSIENHPGLENPWNIVGGVITQKGYVVAFQKNQGHTIMDKDGKGNLQKMRYTFSISTRFISRIMNDDVFANTEFYIDLFEPEVINEAVKEPEKDKKEKHLNGTDTGTVSNDSDTVSNRNDTVSNRNDTVSNDTGTVSNDTGTVSNDTGTVSNDNDTVSNDTSTVSNHNDNEDSR